MKLLNSRVFLSVIALAGLGLASAEVQAAGPVVAQQSITQIQTRLSESTIGWHHWRRCCGYGGWGRRGWGGYGYGYSAYGYGYPYGGYAGYSYVRPVIYSYPAYSYYQPRFYTSYSYSSPYCCGYSQPVVYGVSNYSYSTPATVVTSTPTYSAPAVYSSGYSSQVYTPTYSSQRVISSPTLISPASSSYQSPAPYPAPPVEIQQPSTYRAPIATSPNLTVQSSYGSYPMADVAIVNTPTYSTNFVYTGSSPAAYALPGYSYSPDLYHPPATVSTLSRLSAGIVW